MSTRLDCPRPMDTLPKSGEVFIQIGRLCDRFEASKMQHIGRVFQGTYTAWSYTATFETLNTGDHAMKPINAFAWDDYESRIEEMGKPVGVHKLAAGCCQSPVTILPGHLAEQLRWRKVGEEEPVWSDPPLYVVHNYGLAKLQGEQWIRIGSLNRRMLKMNDLYRPAIAGIDYVEGAV